MASASRQPESQPEGGRFGRRALPAAPAVAAYADRATLLREREAALTALVREDQSKARGAVNLLCMALVTVTPGVVLAATVDQLETADNGVSTAVPLVLGGILFVLFGVVPLLVLNSLRRRDRARWPLVQQWATIDRLPEARALPPGDMSPELALGFDLERAGEPATSVPQATEVPDGYGSVRNPTMRFLAGAAGTCLGVIMLIAFPFTADSLTDTGFLAMEATVAVLTFASACVFRRARRRQRWSDDETGIRTRERMQWQSRQQLS